MRWIEILPEDRNIGIAQVRRTRSVHKIYPDIGVPLLESLQTGHQPTGREIWPERYAQHIKGRQFCGELLQAATDLGHVRSQCSPLSCQSN